MPSSKKEEPRKISAFKTHHISGNVDVFNMLQTEINGKKSDLPRAFLSKPRAVKRQKLKTSQLKKIYAHFSSVTPHKASLRTRKAEGLTDKLDNIIKKYWNAHESDPNHVILVSLLTLRDLLNEDSPVSVQNAEYAMNNVAKQYQRQIHEADQLYKEETDFQNDILSRIKSYIHDRYAHLDNPDDYKALSLIARFSRMKSGAISDLNILKESQKYQENYYSFGMKRFHQIEIFNEWMGGLESKRVLDLYKYLREHKVDDKSPIPLSKRLEIYG